MQTIAEARAWAIEEFRRAGADSPAAIASDLLLSSVTGRDRAYILSHTEERLPEYSLLRYRHLVQRHADGEPLQYLTGSREFYGLDFQVTPAVLIPRPETEILVESVLRIIQECYSAGMTYADVGTGSGCIAVSVAHAAPLSRGWATDISGPALDIARRNASRQGVLEQIQFVQSDLLDCFPEKPVFDIVMSNPPYVTSGDYDSLPPGVRDYEPRLALLGGRDGLQCYRRFLPEVKRRLKPSGFLILESGAGQAGRIGRMIEREGLVLREVIEDLQKIPRCVIARNV